jgi:hypothetical protein
MKVVYNKVIWHKIEKTESVKNAQNGRIAVADSIVLSLISYGTGKYKTYYQRRKENSTLKHEKGLT